MQDTGQSFSAMLRQALGDRLRPGAHDFLDMLATDATMEFPFAPEGWPPRLEGRAAIGAYLSRLGALIAFDHVSSATVHAGAEPELMVLEFEGSGRGVATGAAYLQRYISLIEIKDGQIVRYRDYWNPLAVIKALGGDAVAATLKVEAFDRG